MHKIPIGLRQYILNVKRGLTLNLIQRRRKIDGVRKAQELANINPIKYK